MSKGLIYSLAFFLLLSSCNKELPVEEKNQSIFYVEGNLNHEEINVRAGDDGVYMLPSYKDDTIGIRSYIGKIGSLSCINSSSCPGSVEILIREKEKQSGSRLGINQNIQVSEYNYRGPAAYLFESYKATFISKSQPLGVNHFWDFGDGTQSNLLNPVHYYLDINDSVVNPVLTVSANTSCSNSISFQTNFIANCDVDFDPILSNGHLTWNSTPNQNRLELWDLSNGNGYLPLGQSNLPPLGDSIFTACVESTDTLTGCISYKCKNIVMNDTIVNCVANYDIYKEIVLLKDIRDYFEVTIKWQDESGKLYQSDLYDQPVNSAFNIIAVEDYITSSDGQPTKKVTVSFVVRLFGDNELDFVAFESSKSVIAIAYQ